MPKAIIDGVGPSAYQREIDRALSDEFDDNQTSLVIMFTIPAGLISRTNRTGEFHACNVSYNMLFFPFFFWICRLFALLFTNRCSDQEWFLVGEPCHVSEELRKCQYVLTSLFNLIITPRMSLSTTHLC